MKHTLLICCILQLLHKESIAQSDSIIRFHEQTSRQLKQTSRGGLVLGGILFSAGLGISLNGMNESLSHILRPSKRGEGKVIFGLLLAVSSVPIIVCAVKDGRKSTLLLRHEKVRLPNSGAIRYNTDLVWKIPF